MNDFAAVQGVPSRKFPRFVFEALQRMMVGAIWEESIYENPAYISASIEAGRK